MNDLQKLAAFTADILTKVAKFNYDSVEGQAPEVGDEPWTVEEVLRAAEVKLDPDAKRVAEFTAEAFTRIAEANSRAYHRHEGSTASEIGTEPWTAEKVLQAAGVPSLEEKVQILCHTIETARARVLEDFLAAFDADPTTHALLFSNTWSTPEEVCASLVSIVPQTELAGQLATDLASRYPTARISFTYQQETRCDVLS